MPPLLPPPDTPRRHAAAAIFALLDATLRIGRLMRC